MKIHYRWVMVAIGALMTCVAAGAMFSLAVFLQPMTEATGWSRAGVSSACAHAIEHFLTVSQVRVVTAAPKSFSISTMNTGPRGFGT
jgi:hypothetical protein